jgi:hypothetical protein
MIRTMRTGPTSFGIRWSCLKSTPANRAGAADVTGRYVTTSQTDRIPPGRTLTASALRLPPRWAVIRGTT